MKTFRIIIFSIILVLINACSSEEKPQEIKKVAINEEVQIEQSDAKSELNDTNLPLPVEDSDAKNEDISLNLSIISDFYTAKCATCHGNKAELKFQNARVIKDLSKNELIKRLEELKNEPSHALNTKQILNLSAYLKGGK